MIGPDAENIRQSLYSMVDWSKARTIIDAGCGNGYDLYKIAEWTSTEARFNGIDSSTQAIERANTDSRKDERFSFAVANLDTTLPFASDSFDVVVSNNVLECISEKKAFLKEVYRVLKPGGQLLCAHFDWDSQILNGSDKNLIRKIVHAFADWKQGWMSDCDGWMGRRLWGCIETSGLFSGSISSHIIMNTKYESPYYGWERIQDFSHLVEHSLIEKSDYQNLIDDIEALSSRNEYFYSITMFAYYGRKLS